MSITSRTGTKIRVFLVDDHQMVREGLRRMLELEADIEVVGEAGSFEEALTGVQAQEPHVVLMDIKMPGVDGIEATRRLKEAQPDCNIIMLTIYGEYLPQAIAAGAVGYLLKDIARPELSQAIRAVYQGRSSLDLSLSRELFTEFGNLAQGVDAQRNTLSSREMSLLRLIASGASTQEMSRQLFMSDATVKRGVRQLLERLNVRNRSEAVAEAYKRGLL